MTRIRPAFWLLPVGMVASQAAIPAVRYFDISGSTASAENACPVWVAAGSRDDCSYNASNPSPAGTAQWIGPVLGAGYYAPGEAPLVFTNPAPTTPVIAPAPQIPLGGKSGIPIARGFVSIDDKGTPDGTDDVIGGTIQFGSFQRNVGTGPATRMVESFVRVIHRLIPPAAGASNVSAATPNAAGGLDYVVGLSGGSAVFPSALSGSTTSGGGFADAFPSQVASQSSADPGDTPYWRAPGANGIARFEGSTAIAGLRTGASVWGYACSDGNGARPCVTSEVNWDADSRARFDNVLLRLSTDDAGHIPAASAYLVNESDLSSSVAGDDSWNATTLSFTGSEDPRPDAFDDRAVVINGLDLSAIITVLANDVPGVAPVTVTIARPPSHGTAMVMTQPANAVNLVQYTPGAVNFEGVDSFTYLITDGNNDTATGTVAVNLTDPISCSNDTAAAARNTPATIQVLANDAGFDVPPVVVTIPSPPAQGTALVNPDRSVTFTPPTDGTGLFTFSYRVKDGTNEPAQCSVTVNIEGTVAVDDRASAENFVTRDIAVLGNDRHDVLVAPVVIEIVKPPVHGKAFVLPVAGSQLATVRYTSDAGFVGQDTLRYRLRDAEAFVSNEATVTITVSNSRPAAVGDTAAVEDGVDSRIDVVPNDSPGLDVPLTLEITSAPAHGTATVVSDGGGTSPFINYLPEAGYTGADAIKYRITDADGDVSDVVPVAITVQDSAPVAVPDTVNGDARAESMLDVMANDPVGSDLPVMLEITQAPAAGTATVIPESGTGNGRPAIGYASSPGTNTTDTLRYRLRDADGDASDQVAVTVNVTNATPVAVDDTSAVEHGTMLGIGVLDNDAGLVNRPLTLTVTRQPANGTATVISDAPPAPPIVSYKPGSGFVGGDSFRYRVTDGDGDTSNEAVVTLTVVDSTPVAVNDTANGDSRESTAVDVLANDSGLADDPVTIEITGQPASGRAELVTVSVSGGTRPGIGYASNRNSSGSDVVRYRVIDRDGDPSNEATVTFTVANPTPVAVDDIADVTDRLVPIGQPYVVERIRTPFDVLRNDTGRGNRPSIIRITRTPQHGTVRVDSTETTGLGRPGVSYRSNDGYTGPDSFRYTVTDGDDQISHDATVTFEVANILTATPDGSPFPLVTPEGTPLIVKVLDNDGGLAVGPIKVDIVATVNGSATVNPDNTVTFRPKSGFTGRFPSPDCPPTTCESSEGGGFRYRVIDGLNQRAEGAAFVDVVARPVKTPK